MSFYIAGTGSALPEKSVGNDELAAMMDTSDEWIYSRTGIHRRRVVTGETAAALSIAAGGRALEDAGLTGKDVDLVICATLQGDTVTPSQACAVAEGLGVCAPAFDLNAACSAMLYGFEAADGYIATGRAKVVLLVACEILSRKIDWTDRATCVLFGDGAGAVVLRAGEGLLSTHTTCRPDTRMIYEPSYGGDSPFVTRAADRPVLHMAGGEVYKFAVGTMISEMEEALRLANLDISDIAYVLPHQANKRIIEAAKKRFGLSDEKVLMNMVDYGNMSAASIAVLLDEAARAGIFRKGDKLLLVAFGAGMTAGAAVIEWKK